jgi:hypothetical protein
MDINLENMIRLATVAKNATSTPEVATLVLDIVAKYKEYTEDELLSRLFILVSQVSATAVSEATHLLLDEKDIELLEKLARQENDARFDEEVQQLLDRENGN